MGPADEAPADEVDVAVASQTRTGTRTTDRDSVGEIGAGHTTLDPPRSFLNEADFDRPPLTKDGHISQTSLWQFGLDEFFSPGQPEDEPPEDVQFAPGNPVPQLNVPQALPPGLNAPGTFHVPLPDPAASHDIALDPAADSISLTATETPLSAVLTMIAQQEGINIVSGQELTMPVNVSLHNVPLAEALDSILNIAGCTWYAHGGIIYVSRIDGEGHQLPIVQGRQVRVFPLNFVSAADVETVITGLLSPVGHVYATQVDSKDKRRTREAVVVEDLPMYLERAMMYIAEIDQPPRQVLIEAHILEVTLKDNTVHGVNLDYMSELLGADVRIQTLGFANPAASSGFLFSIDGSDLNALVEALQKTTDAKTLASPKVVALNGQEARIQIGERLGYFVTTTTQTSTLQQVEFLDVGIVLRVTPAITADGRVMMSVSPEISTGKINDATGLPDKATTEVETTVMLHDGHGIVIGGLLQESDSDDQSKVPIVGDAWLIGRAFQRRTANKERKEVIVALVPRIVPYEPCYQQQDEQELHRATTRLVDPALNRVDRPWEGHLPDAIREPRSIAIDRLPDAVYNLRDPYPLPAKHYFPTPSEPNAYLPGAPYDPRVPGDASVPHEAYHPMQSLR